MLLEHLRSFRPRPCHRSIAPPGSTSQSSRTPAAAKTCRWVKPSQALLVEDLDAQIRNLLDGSLVFERQAREKEESVRLEDASVSESNVERGLPDERLGLVLRVPVAEHLHQTRRQFPVPDARGWRHDDLAVQELDPIHRLRKGEEFLLADECGSSDGHGWGYTS